MVPLDRRNGAKGTDRYYRCDAGCGRAPVPACGLEVEVLSAVVEAAMHRFPRYTLQRVRTRRVAGRRGDPDQRRDLIRRWIDRVVAGDGQPAQLHWSNRLAGC